MAGDADQWSQKPKLHQCIHWKKKMDCILCVHCVYQKKIKSVTEKVHDVKKTRVSIGKKHRKRRFGEWCGDVYNGTVLMDERFKGKEGAFNCVMRFNTRRR